uniref:Lipoprotein n=1 Tax=Candidatus Kentrum sp. TC TaxID=2126339 RepID=A0A450ZXX6_9GAMM|nr:MAG: hypothetical protein BECKTC1821E_GA0114239_10314 [Candidatus Kentron sp. TC]VFK45697.1 MAG: hypothetical protein BECKTC1821D_GA0114238_102628 [Candidatus Kentron sp. TC]VFK58659.1 MAG: hypothetical protein BECKTC1821F_GA0114240_102536 [Candidatus Kentron sp. TC]
MRCKKYKVILLVLSVVLISGCGRIATNYEANPIMMEQTGLLKKGSNIIDQSKLENRIGKITNKI